MRHYRIPALSTMALVCAGLVAGCAPLPRSVVPVAVSARDFDPLSCNEMQVEFETNLAALDEATTIQRGAAIADMVGLLAITLPPTLITGDKSVDLALAKGNDIALRRAISQKNCLSR